MELSEKFRRLLHEAEPVAEYKLSMPPSLSSCYNNVKRVGRVKSVEYKRWEHLAMSEMHGQKIVHFDMPVVVVHCLQVPDKRKRDCANYEKAASDFFVKIGVLKDDSLIRINAQLWLDWEPSGRGLTTKIFY